MIIKLIPIEETIAKIVDDLGLGDRDLPIESMIEWINSGLKRIGAYDQFEPKTIMVKISDYRGDLPPDFYRVNSKAFTIPHKIGHNTITMGFRDGSVELRYLAMPVDERGYPLVPEEETFQEALLWLVASKLALRDELPNKKLDFTYCDQRWQRGMLAARADAMMGDIQFMQRRANDRHKLKYTLNPQRFPGSVGKEQLLNRNS